MPAETDKGLHDAWFNEARRPNGEWERGPSLADKPMPSHVSPLLANLTPSHGHPRDLKPFPQTPSHGHPRNLRPVPRAMDVPTGPGATRRNPDGSTPDVPRWGMLGGVSEHGRKVNPIVGDVTPRQNDLQYAMNLQRPLRWQAGATTLGRRDVAEVLGHAAAHIRDRTPEGYRSGADLLDHAADLAEKDPAPGLGRMMAVQGVKYRELAAHLRHAADNREAHSAAKGWSTAWEHEARAPNGEWVHGVSSAAAEVMQSSREGFSVGPYTGRVPDTGYMVAMMDHTHTFPEEILDDPEKTAKAITSMLDAEPGIITPDNDVFLGGWVNGGKLWLEPSVNVQDKDEAIKLGKETNQIAIWDNANFEEIQTGGTGGGRITEHDAAGQALRTYSEGGSAGSEELGKHDSSREARVGAFVRPGAEEAAYSVAGWLPKFNPAEPRSTSGPTAGQWTAGQQQQPPSKKKPPSKPGKKKPPHLPGPVHARPRHGSGNAASLRAQAAQLDKEAAADEKRIHSLRQQLRAMTRSSNSSTPSKQPNVQGTAAGSTSSTSAGSQSATSASSAGKSAAQLRGQIQNLQSKVNELHAQAAALRAQARKQ